MQMVSGVSRQFRAQGSGAGLKFTISERFCKAYSGGVLASNSMSDTIRRKAHHVLST